MNTENSTKESTCCEPPKKNFFRRIFAKLDASLKEKAEKQSSCCGSGKDGGKGGKCC